MERSIKRQVRVAKAMEAIKGKERRTKVVSRMSAMFEKVGVKSAAGAARSRRHDEEQGEAVEELNVPRLPSEHHLVNS